MQLSPRQGQVLLALQHGYTNDDIAEMLEISPHTVKFHCRQLYRRYGVTNRFELMARLIQKASVRRKKPLQ